MSGFILSLKIHIHTLNAELRSQVSIGTVFDSLVNIQNSQIMDKDTERRGKCFNASIHSLGFGKNSSVLGKMIQ
ncbi:MAG: hypothetical protein ACR5KX_01450 [Wolbachia sp.]